MSKLKTSLIATSLSAILVAPAALAEVSANFGVTSNYLWRGVTQSADNPSVSGGLDYSNDSGFYAGTWIGSVDFGGEFEGAESDFYLGYAGELDNGFGYDVGYTYYAYTDLDDSNFGELYFNGSFNAFSFGLAYTPNSDLPDDSPFGQGDLYYHVGYGVDLADDYGLGLTYGYYAFDEDETLYGDNDYGHIQVDITKGDFMFTVSKADDESGDDDLKLVVSWGTTF
ncbi:hypothetical protein HMF8227_02743 [Saliniradius amylolyticus]|uniref:Porin domain-containing protein n=1 Tax=Saliniradius amylolyticus TaxID=2183582 RepID=A0A2S2E6A7_9ALTE|nr:TorF family putative porin [Saliniradius amylolyticus]AWL13194.1 hypothetical protein HMF8227_02743 [Saliniradius amylolyticus]